MPVTVPTQTEFEALAVRVTALEGGSTPAPAPSPAPTPPPGDLEPIAKRVAGMFIGKKDYDNSAKQQAMAKMALLVLGAYRGWKGDVGGNKMKQLIVDPLKALNPAILIGNYTVMNECRDETDLGVSASADIAQKCHDDGWWLRNADGEMLRYTDDYAAYDIDFTTWAPVDASGDRMPQWLAKRSDQYLFGIAGFDFAYSDNSMKQYRGPDADWKRDGHDLPNDNTEVIEKWRDGEKAYWAALAQATGIPVMGNPDNDLSYTQYKEQLQGAFYEGAMGKSYSFTKWADVWNRYKGLQANVKNSKRVLFNISAAAANTDLIMFGLCTALLGDGMFSLTDASESEDYSNVLWPSVFDVKLGKPTGDMPTIAWSGPVWRRSYTGGRVFVNSSDSITFNSSEFSTGYHYIDGSPVGVITMSPETGLIILNN